MVAFFENVTIGDYRKLELYSPNGTIYRTGTLTLGSEAEVSLDGQQVADPNTVIILCVESIYGDWNGDCVISNTELWELQDAMHHGEEGYNPPMDYNCDGVLDSVDLAAFTANMTRQPPCGERDGGEGGEGGGGDDSSDDGETSGDD